MIVSPVCSLQSLEAMMPAEIETVPRAGFWTSLKHLVLFSKLSFYSAFVPDILRNASAQYSHLMPGACTILTYLTLRLHMSSSCSSALSLCLTSAATAYLHKKWECVDNQSQMLVQNLPRPLPICSALLFAGWPVEFMLHACKNLSKTRLTFQTNSWVKSLFRQLSGRLLQHCSTLLDCKEKETDSSQHWKCLSSGSCFWQLQICLWTQFRKKGANKTTVIG